MFSTQIGNNKDHGLDKQNCLAQNKDFFLLHQSKHVLKL